MSKIFDSTSDAIAWHGQPCTVTLRLVACKKEAVWGNGDTGGVFVMGTPIFKSVMALVSKQRGRFLTRKSCQYLNRWADPLFIGFSRELGYSGDPIRLNSECSWWVDMLQVHRYCTSNRLAPRVPMVWWRGTQKQASTSRGDEYCVSLARRQELVTR